VSCPRPSDHHITTPGRRWGCRQCLPTGVGVGDPAEDAEQKEPKPRQGQSWSSNMGASSTGRRAETKATNGGEADRSPRSEERARGGGAFAPHGDGGDRRSSSESSGDVVGDSQSPGSARG
jgi:hypothetical protein